MVETKSLKVSPEFEQKCIDDMSNFGWVLKSSQEINVKESHLESGTFSNNVYSVTTSEHYVKLVFSRDTAMPNYSKLAQLENEYNTLSNGKPTKPGFSLLLALILLGAIVPGVLYIVFGMKKRSTYKKQNNEWETKFQTRGSDILHEARNLLS